MRVNCSFCEKRISKPPRKVGKSENLFCDKSCQMRFNDEHGRTKSEKMFQVLLYLYNHGPTTKFALADELDIYDLTLKEYLDEHRDSGRIVCERSEHDGWVWVYRIANGTDYNKKYKMKFERL